MESNSTALSAWLILVIYPACYATLLCFQKAGNNVNKKFYIPFWAGPSDRSRSCGLMLPKHALFQLSYTRILVLPTRLERARRCRQEILSLRCLPFHHGSISKLSVQQSTVFPICQYSSTYPSANGLVALLRFELRILQGLSLLRMPNSAIGPYCRSFPAVSPAQGIFGGRNITILR